MWLLLACTDTGGPTALPDTSAHTGAPVDTADSASTGDTAPPPPVYPAVCDVWAEPRDLGVLADESLNEVSGVEPSEDHPGVLWVHEDHGGAPTFYAIDWAGTLLGTVTLEGVENVDMEAMALGPCDEGSCLWMADTGDNTQVRLDPVLYRIPEPAITLAGGLEVAVTPTRFPLSYGEEQSENVEAFALTPAGEPVLLTKRNDGFTRIYLGEGLVEDATNTLVRLGTIATRPPESTTGGFVTSADIWPDGSRLLVRTYERAWQVDLGEAGIDAVLSAPELEIPYAEVVHVEALAYDGYVRGYWQIPEGVGAPISFTACVD